jgi:hypothetical protein
LIALSIILSTGATALSAQPEEPDYFFLTGGPYTQGKNSPQLIWANQWLRNTGSSSALTVWSSGVRAEMGLTSRWEADFEFGWLGLSEKPEDSPGLESSGFDDMLVGVRYRLLHEGTAPFTLTVGPQLSFPTGRSGLSSGKHGYGIDITAAKDWGGLVFWAGSLNLAWAPGVESIQDPLKEATLSTKSWATAVGFRALERPAYSTHHDIHLFLELAGDFVGLYESTANSLMLAPGVRYGFTNSQGMLVEVGMSATAGLAKEAPDWGLIFQFQIEFPGGSHRTD